MSDHCHKMTQRSEKEKKLVNNRLNRISGQINGVKKMIDEDAYCNDVLIQLAAIESAVKSLSNHVLESHLHTCIMKEIKEGNADTVDELIELFKKFNRR